MALAVASCAKEITADVSDSRGGNPTESGKITVNVEALMGDLSPAGEETKSSIAPVVRLTWEDTDVVYAYDATQCLGSLTVTPAGNGTSAKLSGEITSTDASKITLVHCNTATDEPAIINGEISFDLSAQGGEDPFVVWGTLDNSNQTNITDRVVPFLFATSLMRITATGLDEDAVIDNVKVSGLNTVCKLTVSGDGTPSIEGANLGTITKTAGIDKTNDKGQVLFKVAVPASDASSSDRSVEFTIGGKTCTAAFSGAAIESGKAYSAMAENNAVEGIALNKTSTSFYIGSTETLTATVYPLKTNQAVTWASSNAAVATVDANGIVTGVAVGTATITAASQDDPSINATCTVTVRKVPAGFVDLGLPSGIFWAEKNLGASNAWDYGKYYSWGDVYGQGANTGGENTFSKSFLWANDVFGETWDNVVQNTACPSGVLAPEYDAATDSIPSWRMPTIEEFVEIFNNCYVEWGTYNSVNGLIVYKAKAEDDKGYAYLDGMKKYGGSGASWAESDKAKPSYSTSEDTFVFFPAAGYGDHTDRAQMDRGCYWSSSLFLSKTENAYILVFTGSLVNSQSSFQRKYGCSIRPVSD